MPDRLPRQPTVLRFGRYELRLDTRAVRLDGETQAVRRRVFDLIVYLVRQRPRAVPHAELLRALWNREEASPSLLARAVGEARRAVGDAPDNPRLIVTVHGVGYRFAAPAEDPLTGDSLAAPPAADQDVAEEATALAALVAQGRDAVAERRYDDARRLAGELMARAQAIGSHTAAVRGHLVLGAVELQSGTIEQAARHIGQALRMAQAEGTDLLVAEARIASGGLHVSAGDLDTGVRHLRAAMEALSRPGSEPDLMRCLGWLAMALRRQGELEAALQVCRRSIRLGMQYKGPGLALSHRRNEIPFLCALGDREAEQGRDAAAQAHYEEGLALCNALLSDPAMVPGSSNWLGCLQNRAMLLERTDRLEQAWADDLQYRQARAAPVGGASNVGQDDYVLIEMQHARLLARRGCMHEAMTLVRDALAPTPCACRPRRCTARPR